MSSNYIIKNIKKGLSIALLHVKQWSSVLFLLITFELIIKSMNFCQKHNNHHCIHSHQCKDPHHHKANQVLQQKHNKTIAHINSHKNLQSKCKFTKGITDNQQVNKELLSKLHERQLKICELAHRQTVIREKYERMVLENKHLFAQIEYYREQFTSLVQNSNVDNKNEIKKRVIESTDFILKIKALQSENYTLSSENDNLKLVAEHYKKQERQLQSVNKTLGDKYGNTHLKLKQLTKQKEQTSVHIKGQERTYEKLHSDYEILKKQFRIENDKYKKENKILHEQLQILKKQFNKYRSLTQKQKQMIIIQKENETKKQEMYKQRLSQFQTKNKELNQQLKVIDDQNEQLQEDLKYTRQVLDKRQEFKGELTNIHHQLEEKRVQIQDKKTHVRQHHSYDKNKENRGPHEGNTSSNEQTEFLREQVKKLTQKCIQLQSRGMSHYEQVIMNIGASQAFRRLLQQKNGIIKKLIRQKGDIYAKMTVNYH